MESVQIKLTPGEELIFGSLPEGSTTLLCSGGWVRDKLLGHKTCDIDIVLDGVALSNVEYEFVHKLTSRASKLGWRVDLLKQESIRLNRGVVSGKMLYQTDFKLTRLADKWTETLEVDFRELGLSETEHNDVKSRDFTVNALYYDPKTRKVIDLCNVNWEINIREYTMCSQEFYRLWLVTLLIHLLINVG